MLMDNAMHFIKSISKIALMLAARLINRFLLQPVVKRVKPYFQRYKMKSFKKFIRKNPNVGIHIEDGLFKEDVKYIAKKLKSYRQDFYLEQTGIDEKGNNLYSITTTKGNKDLVEHLKKEFEDKNKNSTENVDTEKQSLEDALEKGKAYAEKSHQREPLRHKEVKIDTPKIKDPSL